MTISFTLVDISVCFLLLIVWLIGITLDSRTKRTDVQFRKVRVPPNRSVCFAWTKSTTINESIHSDLTYTSLRDYFISNTLAVLHVPLARRPEKENDIVYKQYQIKKLIVILIQILICFYLPLTKRYFSTEELLIQVKINNINYTKTCVPSYIFDFRKTCMKKYPVTVCPFSLNQYADDVVKQTRSGDALMCYEWARYLSFSRYPQSSNVTPIRLAQAGFFYLGHGEAVRCFCCGVTNEAWRKNDTAFDVHKRLSPNCDFVRGRHTNNVSIHNSEYYVALFSDVGVPDTDCSQHSQSTRCIENGRGHEHDNDQHNISDAATNLNSSNTNIASPKDDRHPSYSTFDRRIDSFTNWHYSEIQLPKQLAEAGFFYTGNRDCVRCYVCGVGVQDWSRDDIPFCEHARLSPNCAFLKRREIRRTDGAASSSRKESEIPGSKADNASPTANVKESKEGTAQTQGGKMHEGATGESGQNCSGNDKTSNEGAVSKVKSNNGSRIKKGLSKDAKAIVDENRTLKAQMTCKICLDKECDVVFLPCGHMIACQQCARALRKCAICRNLIRGMVHVYQS